MDDAVNDFYVYAHIRNDTGAIFYVGKGRGKRAIQKCGRNRHWRNIAGASGFRVVYLWSNVDEVSALALEIETIASLRQRGAALTNVTEGGGGLSGMKFSDDHKRKIGLSRIGRKRTESEKAAIAAGTKRAMTPDICLRIALAATGRVTCDEAKRKISEAMMGRKVSDETRQKLREAMTPDKIEALRLRQADPAVRAKKSKSHTGKKLSEETKRKISENNASHRPEVRAKQKAAARVKPVLCSNGMRFRSIADAIVWLRSQGWPTARQSNVSSCIAGRLKTAYGFTWSFADPE